MQVLCWTLQDKLPLQPACSVTPLWWMLSNGHRCESQRSACLRDPSHRTIYKSLFCICLFSIFPSLSFQAPDQAANPLTTSQEFILLPTKLMVRYMPQVLCPLRERPLTTVSQPCLNMAIMQQQSILNPTHF